MIRQFRVLRPMYGRKLQNLLPGMVIGVEELRGLPSRQIENGWIEEITEEPSKEIVAYPEDFPHKDLLNENNISIDVCLTLDLEGLKALKGIGETKAVEILDYINNSD